MITFIIATFKVANISHMLLGTLKNTDHFHSNNFKQYDDYLLGNAERVSGILSEYLKNIV